MFRCLKAIAVLAAFAAGFLLMSDVPPSARAAAPFGGLAGAEHSSDMSLLHKVDIFRNCQEIYWCGVRRDGRARCGPTLRCRTCRFVRSCRRSTGCVWRERCRWGPYVPPQPQ